MHLIATAGHVDHGKSALVRALTGQEPDRWEAERRRGLSIDLGYAWTTLPGAGTVAFVDVPGHRRFIGNMLAGLGPAPAVLLVVAADGGWSAQSEEHLRAIDALGLRHGLLAVTRADLVGPSRAAEVRAAALARIAKSSLGAVDSVTVSSVTLAGLDDLRACLVRLCAALPVPSAQGRVRLWVDRSFTIAGSGTVVTGSLGAGTIRRSEALMLGSARVTVRGLQSLGQPAEAVAAVARVAVNVRGIAAGDVHRGAALLTPDAWASTAVLDIAWRSDPADLPDEVRCHVGTAALACRIRPLGLGAARLTLAHPLPLSAGDPLILREPGRSGSIVGAVVIDADPPPLTRRGAAVRRGAAILDPAAATLREQVARRGWWPVRSAALAGLDVGGLPELPDALPLDGDLRIATPVLRMGSYAVSPAQVQQWRDALLAALDAHAAAVALEPQLSFAAACERTGMPDVALLEILCRALGLERAAGRVARPGSVPNLGAKTGALEALVARLAVEPFAAPERPDLDAAGLGAKELAAAERLGRLLRFGDEIVLLPSAPAQAMRRLAALPQPFTTSDARQALGTTRRVVIPLLEHLDARGWTRRLDAGHREVVR